MESFGDKLYRKVDNQRSQLFIQGELAELTYQSYQLSISTVDNGKSDNFEVTFPIGYKADNTSINGTRTYTKDDLISRYEYICYSQLPINGIYQLVTITEVLLIDILRDILLEFPNKIPSKRKIDAELVLEAGSLDEVKNSIVNSLINELNYKSPREFAEEFEKYTGIKLLEQPAFHKYIELKATRDIYIHNSGVANSIYLNKAGTLSRVRIDEFLPVTIQYFLESYECCLQLTEVLELLLNKIWPSLVYQESRQKHKIGIEEQQKAAIEKIIENKEDTTSAEEIKEKPKRRKAIAAPKSPTKAIKG
ncbi:hypothetical protein IC235_13735 [Hymenobacter sp. BT664]|uniref:Uncharacterized protein n=1 Tax=Hymenobacter montanus TaxID=2771359 RepID=A0A927BDR1_9BACT|nr:hypothetical protein [Hymenobacter montanus]MBD2768950.1 hypothetical protein [Hymenobacter montanus]